MSSISQHAIDPSASTDGATFNSGIERLRAEHAAVSSPAQQAALLHEIGVLEERSGDEAAAARDHLAAINCDPEFREPLERLVAIIERRQSYKNLGKVLERMVRVAETAGERARALVHHAAFLTDHENDLEGARQALLDAAEETAEDPAVWLALEWLAARLSDNALRERALSARADLAGSGTLRALLLIEVAEQRARDGLLESALDALDRAVSQGGEATFQALRAQERLAHEYGQPDVEAKSLETQAELVLRALNDGKSGDAQGVPRALRTQEGVASLWLRAAELRRAEGDSARAETLLDRALTQLPTEPSVLSARLALADAANDAAAAARLARQALDCGIAGELGAALWLRIAEAAGAESDRLGALHAVEQALALAPACAPARALLLDLMSDLPEAARLAASLEATAEQFQQESAKANAYLVSADTWARLAGDAGGAKAALSQAALSGASPALVSRVARLLAAVTGDSGWYEEATRRLLAQGATEDEIADLWLELVRARALRGDLPGTAAAVQSLAHAPLGAWLGNLLGAYLLPWLSSRTADSGGQEPKAPASGAGLLALAQADASPERAGALGFLSALRALGAGDGEAARRELSALHDREPGELAVVGALSALEREAGALGATRDVLSAAASASDDTETSAALYLASGMLSFELSERATAVTAFRRAAELDSEAATPLLSWALRAAEPDNASARAAALLNLAETDAGLAALERFGLQLERGGSTDVALEALRSLSSEDGDLGGAAEIARAAWGGSDALGLRRDALESLANRGPEAARLAHAVLHQVTLIQGGPNTVPSGADALETAARWARSDTSLGPALEWFAFALAAGDKDSELAARRALVERLPEPSKQAVAASVALIADLIGDPVEPLPATSPAARLANLELALPGKQPARRASALLDARDLLGDEAVPVATAMAGFNQLAAGDVNGAFDSFRGVVEALPSDALGWEGLRAAAEAKGDRGTFAEASAALGDAVSDGVRGSALWEEAATVLLDELGDPVRGEFALSRAVERDIQRFSAFDRLFRIVRARKDGPLLLDLIERRLAVAEEVPEIVRLWWERARALREGSDREGALRALEQVRELEPDHVGALALTGEICITLQRFQDAADNLARLAEHPAAPAQQRLMSGVAAVDLYEGRLKNLDRALEVLMGLYRGNLTTLPVRERVARTAARAGAWDQATEVLEQLMVERDTPKGRVEAARLAIAIYRDELKMPEAAQEATCKLLSEAPSDGEALDLVLTGAFAESVAKDLLTRGLKRLVEELQEQPLQREAIDRTARIAGTLGRLPLRQAALGALVALGSEPGPIDAELARLDERVPTVPRITIDDASLPSLIDPDDSGALPPLFQAIAATISEALGPGLSALGVGKKERVDPRAGLAIRNEIMKWTGALGLGEIELYIGGSDPEGVCVVASETPALVIGKAVVAPLSPYHRQAIARELLALRRGTSVLRHREPEEIHALVVAACRVVEVDIPSPPFALLGEFQRQLTREMPRKVRKLLPDLARAFQRSGQDPVLWYRAATSTLDRMAAIAAGDVSRVLSSDPRKRGHLSSSNEAQARAKRLLSFVLSPTYIELREKLGMGIR